MTQPKFVPVVESAEVRESLKLPAPLPWVDHRPADYRVEPGRPQKPNTGRPGTDQGYALHLAERFKERLQISARENAEDMLAGAVAVALRRASIFGRAPMTADLELALRIYGCLDPSAPPDLVEARRRALSGAHHDYWQQRDLADFVPEATLRMTPEAVSRRLAEDPSSWRELNGLPA